jgi:hypothetical protein
VSPSDAADHAGGPAFPVKTSAGVQCRGMSLHDWYVGKAAAALRPPEELIGREQTEEEYRVWALRAHKMADALLAERARR